MWCGGAVKVMMRAAIIGTVQRHRGDATFRVLLPFKNIILRRLTIIAVRMPSFLHRTSPDWGVKCAA